MQKCTITVAACNLPSELEIHTHEHSVSEDISFLAHFKQAGKEVIFVLFGSLGVAIVSFQTHHVLFFLTETV